MSSVCVITARGGSKRIPRKNIRDFCGKPIIAYSIEAALESGLFDEVMVSTDDSEIADVALRYGANVPFMRSDSTSGDYATTAEVLIEVLEEYSTRGIIFDFVCCMYPTAPFVTADKLRRAASLMGEGIDSVVPVVRFSFPPQRAFIIEDGELEYSQPECAKMRSQDLRAMYHDCGQFYYVRTDAFQNAGSLVAGVSIPLEMPETEVQDIDCFVDWELAEMKYKRMMSYGQDEE